MLEKFLNLSKTKDNNSNSENSEFFNLKDTPSILNIIQNQEKYFKNIAQKPLTLNDLSQEINLLKHEIKELKNKIQALELQSQVSDKIQEEEEEEEEEEEFNEEINNLHIEQPTTLTPIINQIKATQQILSQKWFSQITLKILDSPNHFVLQKIALIDLGADLNCIKEALIPSKYFEKTTSTISTADGTDMQVMYKLSSAHICDNQICLKTLFY